VGFGRASNLVFKDIPRFLLLKKLEYGQLHTIVKGRKTIDFHLSIVRNQEFGPLILHTRSDLDNFEKKLKN